ncbi:interleukin-18 receptor accessory protein-like isoform X2 [Morone saxatilis]|uniref:interleukin-18 receptor accessory protein-like isoform X2 n=1 Tax=Morone saxatilis TaxID=34816 RepID=UPI0015E1D3DE|nr:interleukin-18 receptor accessory protein-like isoform X2 [Morone saxatilis]
MTERRGMQITNIFLFFLIFPISLEGCCEGNHKKKTTGLQQNIHQHYRAVEGEMFMMPCLKSVSQVVWSSTGEQNERLSFDCGSKFLAEAKHSGNYTCLTCGSKLSLHLQVVEKNSLGCQSEESSVILFISRGGVIYCPGFNCSDNTDVIWYKDNKYVSEQPRHSCEENGQLHLCQVKEKDTGQYFCDRKIIEQGVRWVFKRAVHVTAMFNVSRSTPTIVYPTVNTTEEVELGQSHTLECVVHSPIELKVVAVVQWYMHHGGNMENMTLLHMKEQRMKKVTHAFLEVTGRVVVTPQHLNHRYTCIASNSFGKTNVTIQLKKKMKVILPSLGGPIVCLLLVAGLGIILHIKWLEVKLIYRSHFQHGKHNGDEKEFDVFLSYVGSLPSAEVEGGFTISSKEACLSSMDLLNSEEGKATQRPEVQLPQVLEDQWGYRLCLLERDVLPGGAYTNDVVLAIHRSQMLICLLSADYLSNNNAVFVLESGVQALLQNSTLKLLLIWTSRASSLIQPDPPLPTLVQRALKVLPSMDWTSGKTAGVSSNFWRSLREAMPNHRVSDVSHAGPLDCLTKTSVTEFSEFV